MSIDYPGLPYVQAEGYTVGRPDGPVLWWVIHTMEVAESLTAAEGTANYFANPPDDRDVSAHLCVDADSAVQCVRVTDSAWTVGNRPGNRRGLNVELAGRAGQGITGWADAYSQSLLRRAAALAAIDVLRFAIPIRFCTVAQLQARDKGFTTHVDLRDAFGGTTHWDPGPDFPRAQFLELVRSEVDRLMGVDDMTPKDLLDTTIGSSGPTVGIALQSGYSYAKAAAERAAQQLATLADLRIELATRNEADRARDEVTLAAVQALATSGGTDAAPILAAIDAAEQRLKAHYSALVTSLQMDLAQVRADNARLRELLAGAAQAEADALGTDSDT